jgi:hypothetical protein
MAPKKDKISCVITASYIGRNLGTCSILFSNHNRRRFPFRLWLRLRPRFCCLRRFHCYLRFYRRFFHASPRLPPPAPVPASHPLASAPPPMPWPPPPMPWPFGARTQAPSDLRVFLIYSENNMEQFLFNHKH